MIAFASERPLGASRLLSTVVLVGAATLLLLALLLPSESERLAGDFRGVYLPAAELVREGESPYPAPDSPLLEAERAYVYPPLLAVLLVPLTFVREELAVLVAFGLSLTALVAALVVLGVRDVRCYAALLLWAPVWNALETANVSAFLALALALLWRWRETLWRSGLVLGLSVAVKLILWPMLVWTIASRRARQGGLAILVGTVVTAGTWAAIGFAGLTAYPDLLARASSRESYSIGVLVAALGLPDPAGDVIRLIVGGTLLGLCAALARGGDEPRSFSLGVAACLAFSPVVWQHYLAVLAVPLAIFRPKFSALWLLPVALWASPRAGIGTGLESFLPAIVAAALLTAVLLRPRGAGLAVRAA